LLADDPNPMIVNMVADVEKDQNSETRLTGKLYSEDGILNVAIARVILGYTVFSNEQKQALKNLANLKDIVGEKAYQSYLKGLTAD
ncbi:MAG: hypothetical protein EBU93_01060, partial [Chlamydiae bacterium]|nr:hypothetical protein [Chlamydiota bacterium]